MPSRFKKSGGLDAQATAWQGQEMKRGHRQSRLQKLSGADLFWIHAPRAACRAEQAAVQNQQRPDLTFLSFSALTLDAMARAEPYQENPAAVGFEWVLAGRHQNIIDLRSSESSEASKSFDGLLGLGERELPEWAISQADYVLQVYSSESTPPFPSPLVK